MKTFFAAAALAVLCSPAFAGQYDYQSDYQTGYQSGPDYGAGHTERGNPYANASKTNNACLTRGTDDPRFETSSDSCGLWMRTAQAREAYKAEHDMR